MSIDPISARTEQLYYKRNVQDENQDKTIEDELNPVEKTLVNSVAPARRIIGMPDMVKHGDGLAAAGLAALTVVSLPEDCRDLRAAYDHSACVLRKKRLNVPYNYRKYQHDFSFLRGTLLHELFKRIKSPKGKNIVSKIYKSDVTLYDTKLGKWVKNILGIIDGNSVKTHVKDLYGREVSVKRMNIKKDFLGFKDLTGRAMKRTTVLGLTFMGLLELPKVVKAFVNGKDKRDKAKQTAIQSGKSALNIFSVSAGMGYLGAIGAKKFGALGSLLGMGLGVIAGATASKGIQHVLSKKD